jgi:TIR domain
MTDIFFSYKSDDRDRVRLVRDAFVALGFDVFWDQQVPAGVDWDSWIRRHLAESKCAIVFWSSASAASDNVRHEATVAKQQGKLVAALLEPLTAAQFPMGMYTQQAANLAGWRGDFNDAEWDKLRREVEAKLIPRWMQQRIDDLEAALTVERARREAAESRSRALRAQIAKEAQGDEDLRQERDKAIEQVTALRTAVEQLNQALSKAQAQTAQATQRADEAEAQRREIERQLKTALARTAKAEAGPRVSGADRRALRNFFLAHRYAIISIGFVVTVASYVLWQSRPANDVKAPPSGIVAPPTDASGLPKVPSERMPDNKTAAGSSSSKPPQVIELSTIRNNAEVFGSSTELLPSGNIYDCQRICNNSKTCTLFTRNKNSGYCFLYATGSLRSNMDFDSGARSGTTIQVQFKP